MAAALSPSSPHLRVSLYAGMLAAAGLPLYIHLPQFASRDLGMDLATLGLILGGLRVLDFVQDPALGWLVDRLPQHRALLGGCAAALMAMGFPLLFTFSGQDASLLRVILALVLIFSGFSLGTILFYSQTAALAEGNESTMLRLAGFREGGSLIGVILAAAAPGVLIAFGLGYETFGLVLAALCIAIAWACRALWSAAATDETAVTFQQLRQSGALGLLGLACLNSLPVAITSTLFLFFVEDRLLLPAYAGPFLILFFLSAACAVPFWTRQAQQWGPRTVLLPAMILAVMAFIGAALLPPGAAFGFALICMGSGAALGADMVLLPLMFSLRLSQAGLKAGQAFGLWGFAAKLSLAAAAVLLLPALDLVGYAPGDPGNAASLMWLTLAYAVLPCILKLIAIVLVAQLPREGALI